MMRRRIGSGRGAAAIKLYCLLSTIERVYRRYPTIQEMGKWGLTMKTLILRTTIAAAAAMAISTSANAAISITVDPTVTNYATDVAAIPDTKIIWDFDTIFAPGFNYSPVTATDVGTTMNISRAPTGDPTRYGSVNPLESPAVFTSVLGLKTFSFLVGSPDPFNRIVFRRADSSVLADLTGATGLFGSTSPINGSNIARRISYNFGGEKVTSIEFYSNATPGSYAFEFDRFAGAVPEPATWAMMLLGFFGLGSVVRNSRRQGKLFAVA